MAANSRRKFMTAEEALKARFQDDYTGSDSSSNDTHES